MVVPLRVGTTVLWHTLNIDGKNLTQLSLGEYLFRGFKANYKCALNGAFFFSHQTISVSSEDFLELSISVYGVYLVRIEGRATLIITASICGPMIGIS
jgi:hypothetical protein